MPHDLLLSSGFLAFARHVGVLQAVEASAAKLMTTADELRTAFAEANAACLEGLMMKDVTSKYVPNDRKLWLKLKKDYLTDADCRRARRRPERL